MAITDRPRTEKLEEPGEAQHGEAEVLRGQGTPGSPAAGCGPETDKAPSQHDYHHPAAGWGAALNVGKILIHQRAMREAPGIVFKMNHGCLDEHVRIGVQRVRNQWRVRWNQTEMAYGDPPHLAFFQKVTALIEAKFSTPFHKQRGALGFIPVVSNDHLALLPPAELRIAAEADAPTAESGGQPAKG